MAACEQVTTPTYSRKRYGWHLKGGSRDRVGEVQMLVRWRLVSWSCRLMLSSAEEVSISDEEMEEADPVTPVSVVDTVPSEPEVEVSEVAVSVSEVSMSWAVPRMDTSEAVASAT